MTTDLRKAAQDALDALKHRLDRIHTAALDGRPKQAFGEMVYAMTQMPEWDTLRASLAQPDDAKQRLLEIMRRNGLATGHGDTLKQVIDTLEVELTDTLAAMCEWTRHGFGRTYDTACKSGYVRFVTRPDVWKFCPNCGKKIRFIDGDNNGTR